MAFENSQAFVSESKRLAGTKQFECMCRLEVQEGKQIKRVINVSALPKITTAEKVADNISFAGRTSYQVVYESEDGSLASVFATAEWQDKIGLNVDNFFLCPVTIENNITGFSSNEVAISSLVNIDVYYVAQEKINSVTNLSLDYVVQEKTYEYEKLVNMTSESFNEVAEHEYNGRLQEILYYTADVRLKNTTAGIDSITLEGEVNLDVYAVDNGRIVSINKVVDFRQEMASLSVVPNNLVDAGVRLNDLKVTASVNETDNKSNLIMSIEIGAYALVFAKESKTIVEDAFSTANEINASYECVSLVNFESQGSAYDNVTGVFETDRDIYELCFVSSVDAVISEVKESGQSVNIVGAIEVEAICETETREKVKVKGVIPFVSNVHDMAKQDQASVTARINASRLRGQREIEVIAEICVEYKKSTEEYVNYLSQIEETETPKETLSAIKVYVAKENQDLFGVAKAISVRPEVILAQNPSAQDGIAEGTRLVIYSPLDTSF